MVQRPSYGQSILFAKDDERVFVVDIPMSIALAQGTEQCPWSKKLLSREPLEEPLRSLEPKSEKAMARIQVHGQGDGEREKEYMDIVKDALRRLGAVYDGPFCLPQFTKEKAETASRKQSLDATEELSSNPISLPSTFFQSLALAPASYTITTSTSQVLQPWSPIMANPETHPLAVQIRHAGTSPVSFHLPPKTSFLLSTLPPATPSHTTIAPQGFNIILLDPPWPNRSAKRASSYSTPRIVPAVRDVLDGLQLSAHMATTGPVFVAVWITNSSRVREAICGQDGWLASLRCDIVEEWIWVKVTAKGEPVTAMDGVWRKPYEVLVIGRVQGDNTSDSGGTRESVKRRVILGVPDLHSRKPCLMVLFERLLSLPPDYVGLEVFARNLTAGWHAWGNEVLMFNWDGCWKGE